MDAAHANKLTSIAREAGADVLEGKFSCPSDADGCQLGDMDLRKHLDKYQGQPVVLIIAPIGPDSAPTRIYGQEGDKVGDEGRNGLITAIGLVLGFTIAFFAPWTFSPGPWKWSDAPVVFFILVGVFLLLLSLYSALIPYNQRVPHYERTVHIFIGGVAAVFIGFVIGLFV